MLAKEPSHGYELRARLDRALGPLGEAMNVAVLVGRRLSEYARTRRAAEGRRRNPGSRRRHVLDRECRVGAVAAAVGIGVGWLTAPLLTNPGAALIGTPSPPSLTAISAIEVLGVATRRGARCNARARHSGRAHEHGPLPCRCRSHAPSWRSPHQALAEAAGADALRVTARRVPTPSGAPQHSKHGW